MLVKWATCDKDNNDLRDINQTSHILQIAYKVYIDGLVQDCSISSALGNSNGDTAVLH